MFIMGVADKMAFQRILKHQEPGPHWIHPLVHPTPPSTRALARPLVDSYKRTREGASGCIRVAARVVRVVRDSTLTGIFLLIVWPAQVYTCSNKAVFLQNAAYFFNTLAYFCTNDFLHKQTYFSQEDLPYFCTHGLEHAQAYRIKAGKPTCTYRRPDFRK